MHFLWLSKTCWGAYSFMWLLFGTCFPLLPGCRTSIIKDWMPNDCCSSHQLETKLSLFLVFLLPLISLHWFCWFYKDPAVSVYNWYWSAFIKLQSVSLVSLLFYTVCSFEARSYSLIFLLKLLSHVSSVSKQPAAKTVCHHKHYKAVISGQRWKIVLFLQADPTSKNTSSQNSPLWLWEEGCGMSAECFDFSSSIHTGQIKARVCVWVWEG